MALANQWSSTRLCWGTDWPKGIVFRSSLIEFRILIVDSVGSIDRKRTKKPIRRRSDMVNLEKTQNIFTHLKKIASIFSEY